MSATEILRSAYVPPSVDQSPVARARRWIEILRRSRSPRLTYLSARYRASDPVLTVLRSGEMLEVSGMVVRFQSGAVGFTLVPDILPAIDLFSEMVAAGYCLCLHGERWRIDVPNGPSFLVESDSLVSDLAVIGLRFLKQEYGFFDVAGCTVLDIGGNIGDSALYFLSTGAQHISAYEPFAATIERARANVALNSLESQILLHHCGVAGREDRRTFRYDGKIAAGLSTLESGYQTKNSDKSECITLIPFSEAVRRVLEECPGRLACKMDCEGSEFEIFEEDPDLAAALSHIDRMLIEYHWKEPEPILRRLGESGFDVASLPLQPGVGLILALRSDEAT